MSSTVAAREQEWDTQDADPITLGQEGQQDGMEVTSHCTAHSAQML